ncbi:MAG TPA: hypothetical protein VK663_01085 [Burkholderiales bacterium]|nr:hypothetical protein [Burkholderiales bacterium]
MKSAAAILALCLTGCTSIPSIEACDTVRYTRDGLKYSVSFSDCHVQVNAPVPGLR